MIIEDTPELWPLMQRLAQHVAEFNGDTWHTFSIQLRPADRAVWISDASLCRTLIGLEPSGAAVSKAIDGTLSRVDL
jgi:hypothetical protein